VKNLRKKPYRLVIRNNRKTKQIAEELGVNHWTLKDWLRRYGFIAEYRSEYSVEKMCMVFTFYGAVFIIGSPTWKVNEGMRPGRFWKPSKKYAEANRRKRFTALYAC